MKLEKFKVYMATQRLIDSVWTLLFEIDEDDKAHIIHYSRELNCGYQEESTCFDCKLEEDSNRHVLSISLKKPKDSWNDVDKIQKIEVENPQYIFSYTC